MTKTKKKPVKKPAKKTNKAKIVNTPKNAVAELRSKPAKPKMPDPLPKWKNDPLDYRNAVFTKHEKSDANWSFSRSLYYTADRDFRAFKKVCGGHVLTLTIPRGTKIFSSLLEHTQTGEQVAKEISENIGFCRQTIDYLANFGSTKCRSEMAVVTETPEPNRTYKSIYTSSFKYKMGTIVRPTFDFYEGSRECASGIHWFFEKRFAKAYS